MLQHRQKRFMSGIEAPRTGRPVGVDIDSIARLKAVILLGGSVRPTLFQTSIRRSILDMPADADFTILGYWLQQVGELARLIGKRMIPVKVMVDQSAPMPTLFASRLPSEVTDAVELERDPLELRGTGGVLHDLSDHYGDDDVLLVASARQLLIEPLPSLVAAIASRGGDVNVVCHEDGIPSGIMLVRCACLRKIARIGYVDMKEQALPQIARDHSVGVLRRAWATGLPLRSLPEYVESVRVHHRILRGQSITDDIDASAWRSTFAVVEAGADVDPGARLHDAIVLRGARVEADTVVARSVVAGGGVVARGRIAVDEMVAATRL